MPSSWQWNRFIARGNTYNADDHDGIKRLHARRYAIRSNEWIGRRVYVFPFFRRYLTSR